MRIPLAGPRSVEAAARRTRVLRLGAGAFAVGAAAAAALAAVGLRGDREPFLPPGADGIVVLDVSASIASDTYARIAATLSRLAASEARYGLVLVSDTAYEALPPGTPAAELRRFERFFRIPERAAPGQVPQPPRSPWTDAFSAGTRLSSGLLVALDVVRRDRLDRPAVLLVSDLDDDVADVERLTSAALSLRREGAHLRIVSLNAAPEDERLVRRLLARPVDLVQARLPDERSAESARSLPRLLAVLAVVLALALASVLATTEAVRWRRA